MVTSKANSRSTGYLPAGLDVFKHDPKCWSKEKESVVMSWFIRKRPPEVCSTAAHIVYSVAVLLTHAMLMCSLSALIRML